MISDIKKKKNTNFELKKINKFIDSGPSFSSVKELMLGNSDKNHIIR